MKQLFLLYLCAILNVSYADLVIHKITATKLDLRSKNEIYQAEFILKDTSNNTFRKCRLTGLPRDKTSAETMILARAQELWDEGAPWSDSMPNYGPRKDFNKNIVGVKQMLTDIDRGFVALTPSDKQILKKIVQALFAVQTKE